MYLFEPESKKVIKFEKFRQTARWEETARDVCNWVNSNLNVCRLVSITAILCSYDNKNLVNVFYNEGFIAPDILAQASNEVLAYEILTLERTMMNSWFIHNGTVAKKVEEITSRA